MIICFLWHFCSFFFFFFFFEKNKERERQSFKTCPRSALHYSSLACGR